MKERFDTFLDILSPHIPGHLISNDCISRIRSVACGLPAKLTTFFGFECRLHDDTPVADFLIHIQESEGGREILAGEVFDQALAQFFEREEAWARIRDFCREWSDPFSRLEGKTDHLWLEFDMAKTEAADIPIPNFFFGRPDSAGEDEGNQSSKDSLRSYLWITESAFPILFNGDLPEPFKTSLSKCFETLPDRTFIFQMGAMLSRPMAGVRLCIREITPESILEYLSRLGWSGSLDELRTITLRLAPMTERIDLDIDVLNQDEPKIGPKVGLECYFGSGTEVERRIRTFLDYLVNERICTTSKQEGLLAYPGYSHEYSDRDLWPSHLLRASSFLGPMVAGCMVRALHHIKIVYEDMHPLTAKAYLAAFHKWGFVTPPAKEA